MADNNTSKNDVEFFNDIREKWQKKWAEAKTFQPEVNESQKKFFLTFPYPYINAFTHVGHLYTICRVDALARFKRSKGYNVLFPQGWHATGSPIVSAAKRVREREEKQVKIMAGMDITGDQLNKFEDPKYWIEFFAPEAKDDYTKLGLSIDWRREFFTTSLNPHYDKFIEWQFRKLQEKDFVIKGKFPVVWDPIENVPVGDHDRVEGEGEVPQEFVLLKFKYGDDYLVAATLRPETMFGQTNLWVGPEIEYIRAKVDDETWIISEECAEKLKQQDHEVEILEKVLGKYLIGKKATAPVIDREIIILPATFCNPNKGTGIVTSVPSDAPDDWMGLVDLKKNPKELEKYGLSSEDIESIEIIPIINAAELGDMAAQKVVEDMNIKNSKQRDLLEKAKKLVYKKGFYEGTMLESTGKYSGMKVEHAKNQIKRDMLESKDADLLFELTGKVVARSLSNCVVKIVSDQWFLDYDNPEWKKLAHKCLDNMKLYPEKARQQFDYVIDWLHQWACTREEGLGTLLPWDNKWLIESLSDSTIYMAYYTIAHRIKEINPEDLDDNFFDYVFWNKDCDVKVDKELADDLRKEFNYWYPLDFRNSGKDLIQNHLTFSIFNHTAIFPEDKWPQSFGVNGWVTVDGQKMSKSLGNVIPVRDMVNEYSADIPRVTILSGGEELDDPNWDSSFAKSMVGKLAQWLEFVKDNYNKGREDMTEIDNWMEARINEIIKKSEDALELTLFRTAFQAAFFEFTKNLKWYMKRSNDNPNKEIMNKAIEAQIIMMQPFTPHICEEAWEAISKDGFASTAAWPEYKESKIEEDTEWIIRDLVSDMHTVSRLAKLDKITNATLFVSESWKYDFFDIIKEELKESKNPKELIGKVMSNESLKKYGKDIMKILPKVIKAGSVPQYFSKEKEMKIIEQAKEYLSEEFGCEVKVIDGNESNEAKAKQAAPAKPAIIVE